MMEMDNVETIKRAVEIDVGIAIVPEPTVSLEVKNETLKVVQFSGEVLMRPLGLISKRGRRFTQATQKFIDFLKDKPAQQAPESSDRVLQAIV